MTLEERDQSMKEDSFKEGYEEGFKKGYEEGLKDSFRVIMSAKGKLEALALVFAYMNSKKISAEEALKELTRSEEDRDELLGILELIVSGESQTSTGEDTSEL